MGAKKVRRTADGGTGGNTIRETTGVTIVLDQPTEADDKFRLVSADPKLPYDKTLGASDAKELTDGYKTLRFDSVRLKGHYRLVHKRAKGDSRIVFRDTPFQDLTDSGHKHKTAQHHYLTLAHAPAKQQPDRYGTDRDVDEDLVDKTFKLLSIEVEDPEL